MIGFGAPGLPALWAITWHLPFPPMPGATTHLVADVALPVFVCLAAALVVSIRRVGRLRRTRALMWANVERPSPTTPDPDAAQAPGSSLVA